MNPQPLDDHQDSAHFEAGEGVGRRLRAARVERGLGLDQVASQLHLNPSLIDALEAGRYEALPGPVFVAGYIRNYARQVGLDPEPLIASYLSSNQHAGPTRVWVQPRATHSGLGGSAFLIRLMTVVLIAGVAYLFAQWWQNRAPTISELAGQPAALLDPEGPDETLDRPSPKSAEPPEPHVAGPSLTEGSPAERNVAMRPQTLPAAAVAVPVIETPIPPPAPASPPEATSTEPVPADQATEPATVPESIAQQDPEEASAEAGDVVLEFRGPCWVDVRDSAKSFSLTGEMSNGDRRVLGGTPPYSLILGNTSAVTVTVKGAPFDLTRVAKGNVARFKLDPATLP